MIGRTLSHYQIEEKLGAGGMGDVYLARDTRLKRRVALKVLPPEWAGSQERLMRFRREAEVLAALNHPNIVTIHSVEEADGHHFLTMELVDGKRLSDLIAPGGMALKRMFQIVVPLTEALATAHERGVIHRDLKPGNIMVTADGRVKVLDFGLAKLRAEILPEAADDQPTEPLTQDSNILGTMPYMSPEQLEGEEVDVRSDLFSLGVILYEMATGERPFKGKGSASLISSIMTEAPQDADQVRTGLPHHLSRIIRRCLEKDPDRRYQDAKDVRNELADLQLELQSSASRVLHPAWTRLSKGRAWNRRAVAGSAALLALALATYGVWRAAGPEEHDAPASAVPSAAVSERKMIVVLPFENLGPPEDEYFADGMTDEIASRLASVAGVGVISRTSAMQYKRNRPPLQTIADDLGVDYVLEGSVRWEHEEEGWGRVRIIPQLIRVADDTQLWSDRYVEVLDDVFEVQSAIAEEVMRELELKIGDPTRRALLLRPTENLAAYQAYLKGQEHKGYPDYSEEQLELAAQRFERATALDPAFAEAWAGLAYVHSLVYFNSEHSRDRLAAASNAIERARELAPDSPTVRAASGYYYYRAAGDYKRALEEFELALREQPGDVEVLAGIGFVRRRQGQWEESLKMFKEAFELDPRVADLAISIAETHYAMRQYDLAAPFFERAVALTPDQAEIWGAKVFNQLELTGSIDAARGVLKQAPVPADPRLVFHWAILDLYERDFAAALRRLAPAALAEIGPLGRAELHRLAAVAQQGLGRQDLARERLELGRQEVREALEDWPNDPFLQRRLAHLEALLGMRDAALERGRAMAEQLADDAFSGPRLVETLAKIHAALGNQDEALRLLEQLLARPYQDAIGVTRLTLDADWDPVRDHPKYRELLQRHRAEVAERSHPRPRPLVPA